MTAGRVAPTRNTARTMAEPTADTATEPAAEVTLDEIVALCKRRGFIFPSSEIYGGLGSTYDYGHYGVLLKNNVKAEWWRSMLHGARRHRRPRLGDPPAPAGLGGQRPPRRLHRPAGRLPHLQAALPRRQARGRAAARRSRRSCRARGPTATSPTPASSTSCSRRTWARCKDTASTAYLRPETAQGIFINFKNVTPVRAQEAAVRDRPDRQVVPQRDHPRQLRLPHPRVRADGDGVLRPPRRGAEVVRVLDAGALRLVRPARNPAAACCACARTTPTSSPTTRPAPPTSSTCSRSAGRSWRGSPTAATSTSASTPSSPARSSSTSTRRRARPTSRT